MQNTFDMEIERFSLSNIVNNHALHTELVKELKQHVDDANLKARPVRRYSMRIKPSSIGQECVAKSWYAFRWAKKETVPEVVNRFAERGNQDERRMIEWLRKAGFFVKDTDPERVAAGKARPQFKFSDMSGHLVGFIDAEIMHPVYTGGTWVLLECKSKRKKLFTEIEKKSLAASDASAHAQIQMYMAYRDYPFALAMVLDAEANFIHFEIIMPNNVLMNITLAKARAVKESQTRPARISEKSAWHECKYMCPFLDVCHNGAALDRNCRSCSNCAPADDGQFICKKWETIIPNYEAMVSGCPEYSAIA